MSTFRRVKSRYFVPSGERLEVRELLAFDMTPQEQLLLELVNRARANPTAEAARYGVTLNQGVAEDETIDPTAKQPLAPNDSLISAIRLHVQDMLDRDFFGHENPDGKSPSDRALAAGYPVGAGENIAWSGNTLPIDQNQKVYEVHHDLFLSVGHRVNMMRANWREIGPGVRYGFFTNSDGTFHSIMAGTMFGDRGGSYFLTGVAISDAVTPNNFYDIGEGLAGVTITARLTGSEQEYTTVTGASGGYALQVPDGVYTIQASGGSVRGTITIDAIRVAGANRKVDINSLPKALDLSSVHGIAFEDRNGNGQRDPGENGLSPQRIYIDWNLDGAFQTGETSTLTKSSGEFDFYNLPPGTYVFRQVVPTGWEQTVPADAFQATPHGSTQITGIEFGAMPINLPPVARDDFGQAVAGQSTLLDILANDVDPEGQLDHGSAIITAQPRQGSVRIDATTGKASYTPNPSYVGPDSFRYTVADVHGSRSASARVSLDVSTSAHLWQNPTFPEDVNGDAAVAPNDALVIIFDLNHHGARRLSGQGQTLPPPPYMDVNGDDFVSSIDALVVIRLINRQIADRQAASQLLAAAFGTSSHPGTPASTSTPDRLSNLSPPTSNPAFPAQPLALAIMPAKIIAPQDVAAAPAPAPVADAAQDRIDADLRGRLLAEIAAEPGFFP